MGKSWDKTLPDIGIFKECFRVLKPGAFAFVMSAPRSDVCARMMLMLEDAGFEIGFTPIYWTYASGFPKAMNIGKMVDKRNGVQGEVVGKGKAGSGMNKVKGFGVNTTKGGEATTEWDVREVVSDLDGSYGGFQPKPAVEVVIVAMKPLSEKTYVDQALKNGKGITWLDDCRIPTVESLGRPYGGDNEVYGEYSMPRGTRTGDALTGRFPANLLVSDDVLNDGRVQKSGRAIKHNSGGENFGGGKKPLAEDIGYADSGSYSRYFDLDAWAKTLPFLIVPKASKSEKNAGLAIEKTNNPRPVGVAFNDAEPNGFKDSIARGNHHPTVKPLKLMSYLITLGSRPGDVVLDPFLGSGTTAVAAKQLGRECIGIEREKEYCDIARARLDAINPTLI